MSVPRSIFVTFYGKKNKEKKKRKKKEKKVFQGKTEGTSRTGK